MNIYNTINVKNVSKMMSRFLEFERGLIIELEI